ncbi:TonB-dependent receptor, partial [Leptolyngbya sp. AN03gr2]
NFLLSLTTTGASFDAEGDRIPIVQGTDDSTAFNGLAKIGFDIDPQQRLQFSLNYFNDRRETNVISDPIVNRIPGVQKARAREVGSLEFIGADPQGDRNTVLNLGYTHRNVLGGELQTQLFYRDNTSRTDPRDRRNRRQGIFQGELDSQNWGRRLQLNTPIARTASVLWGLDYTNENTESFRNLFDAAEFDATNGRVYRKIGEVTTIPPYELSSLGLFAQAQWNVGDRFILSGGLRHERIGFEVGNYTTLFGDAVQGGKKDFSATVFNVGGVYKVTRNVSLFANFAQGFSVPDFGSILFAAPDGFNVGTDQVLTEPQRVNNYEIGIKGQWSSVQASLSGFYSTSKLGTSFVFNEETNFYDVVRSPERTYGIEAAIDVKLSRAWQIGGTAGWIEGEFDEEDTGNYTALSGLRIPPLKLTAYVENETLPGWRNRLQAQYVGNRDRAFVDGADPAGVTNYFTVDYVSSIRLGGGTLQLGIENLFNAQYFPAYAQRLSGLDQTFYTAGRGRTISVRYAISF